MHELLYTCLCVFVQYINKGLTTRMPGCPLTPSGPVCVCWEIEVRAETMYASLGLKGERGKIAGKYSVKAERSL